MAKTSKIPRDQIVKYALPRLQMGVPKVRIAADLGLTRQNLDYHLEKHAKSGADNSAAEPRQ